jgi:hypothetical protein
LIKDEIGEIEMDKEPLDEIVYDSVAAHPESSVTVTE